MKKIWGQDYDGLNRILKDEREQGKSIAMCSGTFDLCHIGHMRMLAEAKKQGDILVVVVKSDNGASLKKEDPPVISQEYRMEAISNILAVDYVVLADYDTSRSIKFDFSNTSSYQWLNMFEPVVRKIRPDVFVHEDNPEIKEARRQLFSKYEVTGIIQPRTEGISTTQIIDKIKTRLLLQMQEDNKK